MAEATAPGAFTATTPATQLELLQGGFGFAPSRSMTGSWGSWPALANRNPFLTPGWLTAWWTAFGPPGRAASAVRCETADGRLVTLLPLYLWRRQPVRILQFIGHGPSDLVAPAVAPGAARRARRTA